MPLLYDVPAHLVSLVNSQQASVVGAIIKDTATGQVLGHVQQTSALQQLMQSAIGSAGSSGFSPLSVVSVVQNEQLKRGIADLQNSMVLMQNLQYGTLALSGLGLGVSIAGFAATIAKLNAIEKRLDTLSEEVALVTTERREDDLKATFADVGADLQNVDTLIDRRDPKRVAEQLQLSLARSARRIEVHFMRDADIGKLESMSMAQLDRMWTLAAGIRLCQEAAIQALFAADELEVAQKLGRSELERQMALLELLNPDAYSRLIGRSAGENEDAGTLRREALSQARLLTDGIKGGVLGLASQISIAETLQQDGISGIEYLQVASEADKSPLLCLTAGAPVA
ncbi:hypothetical protein [Thioclava nitratireducens]|uniref:hypothetical protein n=1 Tax=Thioclava nitratireducens TaxID=1915078 RepID=UPI00248086F0|nr:hypothetical protein [Thioclava nitratireducens]WGT51463.1 hypothetical protein P0N61_05395 [Thioclava nitratireducens]